MWLFFSSSFIAIPVSHYFWMSITLRILNLFFFHLTEFQFHPQFGLTKQLLNGPQDELESMLWTCHNISEVQLSCCARSDSYFGSRPKQQNITCLNCNWLIGHPCSEERFQWTMQGRRSLEEILYLWRTSKKYE